MSTPDQKPSFAPLALKTARLDDTELAQIAQQQRIPKLVRPRTQQALKDALDDPEWAEEAAAALAEIEQPSTPQAQREPRPRKATPRSKMVRLNIELPEYVMQLVKEKAVRDKTTVRGLVLRGLRNLRVQILDEDMVADGRKRDK